MSHLGTVPKWLRANEPYSACEHIRHGSGRQSGNRLGTTPNGSTLSQGIDHVFCANAAVAQALGSRSGCAGV